jgi:hypothetical protein
MSSVTFILPKDYALVAGAAVLTGFLTMVSPAHSSGDENAILILSVFQWQGIVVGKHRKLANVPYPNGSSCGLSGVLKLDLTSYCLFAVTAILNGL